jgi:hypothetical protein
LFVDYLDLTGKLGEQAAEYSTKVAFNIMDVVVVV